MTLILTVSGRESIWMLGDRRLSSKGRAPKDDGRKLMLLDTTDGTAILGYAGLGATAFGTEPADWMAAVLRGRNLSLEHSLGVLAEAMKKQLPRHLIQMPRPGRPAHTVLVKALLNGEVKLYTIDLVFSPDRTQLFFRYTRHVANDVRQQTPRIGLGGSGAQYLLRDKRWIRPLLRLVSAYERGQIAPVTLSDFLSELNFNSHLGTEDESVGPKSIVVWRNRKEGRFKGGGGHQYYEGRNRTDVTGALPLITQGTDLNKIIEVIMPRTLAMFDTLRAGGEPEEFDKDEINAELAKLPNEPDEQLR
jgi:hypothetical protein